MQSIDAKTCKKYFFLRRENSKWSEKNKKLAGALEERIAWIVDRLNRNLRPM